MTGSDGLRVLIAPDCFGDSLTAVQAAEAIADGWRRARPDDELTLAPQSDGGPGFVDVLAGRARRAAHLRVSGPLTAEVDADWVFDDAAPRTAYIECAQACGLALLGGPPTVETALAAHSGGVGQLIAAAVAAGAGRIVVGLGGSSCTDGGRGMIEALGGLDAGTRPAGRRRADRRHRRRASAARADGRGAGVRPAEGRRPRHRGSAGAAADRVGRRTRRRGGRPSATSRARARRAASARACWRWVAGASRGPRSSPSTPTSPTTSPPPSWSSPVRAGSTTSRCTAKSSARWPARRAAHPVLVLAGQVTLDDRRPAGGGHRRRLRHRRPRRIGPAGHRRRGQPAHRVGARSRPTNSGIAA